MYTSVSGQDKSEYNEVIRYVYIFIKSVKFTLIKNHLDALEYFKIKNTNIDHSYPLMIFMHG